MVWENNFFYVLLLNAGTGTAAYGLFRIALWLTHDRYGCYNLYYRLLLGVELFFTVPFAYLYVKLIKGANIYFYKSISGYDGNELVATIFHVAFIVWLIGAIYKASEHLNTYSQTKMLCENNVPYFDERVEEMFYGMYPHKRLKRVKIYQNFLAQSPCVVGVFRPMLILPEGNISSHELRTILAHEATHVICRDNLWKIIGMVIEIACWWNPLFRAFLKDWSEWVETHCDITVCKKFLNEDYQLYAITLMGSCLSSEHVMPPGYSSFKENHSVTRRIMRLSRMHERKGRKGPIALSIALCAIFIAGSGITAFAAGNATSEVGTTAYMNTLETVTGSESDYYVVDLDNVDNVTVFRMSPEELAASEYEVIAMEPEGVSTYASTVHFDWNIEKQTMAASNNFLKLKDKPIEVSAYITATASVRIGVIEPDGTFVYTMAPANTTTLTKYTTTRLGYYKAAIQNVTLADVNASGFYTK